MDHLKSNFLDIGLKSEEECENFLDVLGRGHKVVQHLGSGSFGHVYRVQRFTKTYALKLLNGRESDAFEFEIQKMVESENVVQCLKHGQFKGTIYGLLELAEMDLKKYIKNQWDDLDSDFHLTSKYLRTNLQFAQQLFKGLIAIQHWYILHRDLKPANILIDKNIVKIADFGLSIIVEEENEKLFSGAGTPDYFAPERIMKSGYSFPSDIWAMGVTLFQCIVPWHPFKHCKTEDEMLEEMSNYQWPQELNICKMNGEERRIYEKIKKVVLKCFAFNEAERPTAEECESILFSV